MDRFDHKTFGQMLSTFLEQKECFVDPFEHEEASASPQGIPQSRSSPSFAKLPFDSVEVTEEPLGVSFYADN